MCDFPSGNPLMCTIKNRQVNVCECCWKENKCIKAAIHPNKNLKRNALCVNHAKKVGTYLPKYPCEICNKKDMRQAHYPNKDGFTNRLCAKHAREAGTFFVQNPCKLCPHNNKRSGAYFDENKIRCLCAKHAKISGVHTSAHPCKTCPENKQHDGIYPNARGEPNQLCRIHAEEAGIKFSRPSKRQKKDTNRVIDTLLISPGEVDDILTELIVPTK